MNQSNWFSLDEIEQQQLCSPAKPEQNTSKKPVSVDKLDIQEILTQYQAENLNENLTKHHVIKNDDEDQQKKVNEKSRIKVLCEERDQYGILVNRSTNNNQAMKISMASSIEMIQGLRQAFLSMSEGDIAWFKISNDLLYTKTELAAGIQVTKTIKYYKIELQEVIQPSVSLDMTNLENRLKQIENFRNEGNEFYKKSQYESALLRYQKGLNFLEKWPKKFENDPISIEGTRNAFLIFSGNKAQCLIKLNRYQEAIKILEPVIGQMRNKDYEVKNYYRLISCFKSIEEQEKVNFYLQQVNYICKLNKDEQNLFKQLNI